MIEKTLLLVSANEPFATSEIFTLQFVDGVVGIVQTKLPVAAGVDARIEIQFEPLSVVYSSLTFATVELDHVIFCVVPTIHCSPPFGAVTVTFGRMIEKKLSLTSAKALFVTSEILTLQLTEGVFGIVQTKLPAAAGVDARIEIQSVSLLVEYSSLTLATFELVQVIFCVVPTIHCSPPFGAVTVTFGRMIEKRLSLTSAKALFVTSEILTLQFVEGVFGIVQIKLPALAGIEVRIEFQFVPLLVVNSSLTLATFELVHVIFCVVPTIHCSPPFGLRTVICGRMIEKTLLLESA